MLSPRSPRDGEVLRLLGTYGFLTPVQIAEFVLGDSALTARSRAEVTRRSLRRLRERQLVTTNALLAGDPEGMPTRIGVLPHRSRPPDLRGAGFGLRGISLDRRQGRTLIRP